MPLIKKLLIAILGTMALFMFVSLFLESQWEIKREIVVEASKEKVFPLINSPRNHAKWTPWDRNSDITIVYSFEGPETGKNSAVIWNGANTKPGKRVITKSVLNEKVEYMIYLDNKFSARGELVLETVEKGTRVTWRDYGDLGWNLMGRLIASSANEQIGYAFDKGLMKLKVLAEK
ncbi:MAG: SRPBCC family protein [Leptospirales bacterium]